MPGLRAPSLPTASSLARPLDLLWLIDGPSLSNLLTARETAPVPLALDLDGAVTADAGPAGDRVVVIDLVGPLEKGTTWISRWFGGTSMDRVRGLVRDAAADDSVRGILLRINSPGGTVAGTMELADTVRAAAQAKPVVAQVEDLGASGALWIGAQANRLVANVPTALIGSIGAMAIVEDSSERFERAGVTVHAVTSGPLKATGTPGVQISEEQLEDMQARIDEIAADFVTAVASGRELPRAQVQRLAHGGLMKAPAALKAGLIDAVQPIDTTLSELVSGRMPPPARTTPTAKTGGPTMRFNTHQMGLLESYGLKAGATAQQAVDFYNGLDDDKREMVDAMATSPRDRAPVVNVNLVDGQPRVQHGDDEEDEDEEAEAGDGKKGKTKARADAEDASGDDGGEADDDDDAQGGESGDEEVQAQVQAALRQERARATAVTQMCQELTERGYDLSEIQPQLLNDPEMTPTRASRRVLQVIAGQNPAPAVVVGATGSQRFADIADQALLFGGGVESEMVYRRNAMGDYQLVQDADAAAGARREAEQNGLLGMGLQGLARECLRLAGARNVHMMSGPQLWTALANSGAFMPLAFGAPSHSSGDFPLILEASAQKMLVAGYMGASTTWPVWCQEGSVRDFNTHKKLRLSESPLLRRRAEGAPAHHGYWAEERETYSAEEWALAVGLSRKMMINDDLDAFTQMNTGMGQAVGDTVEYEVWVLLLSNSGVGPTMGDGVALFHANHNNLDTTGAAPSQAEIEAGMIRMAGHTGFGEDGGKRPIAVQPAFLLAGMTDAIAAQKVVAATWAATDGSEPRQIEEIQRLRVIHVPQLTVWNNGAGERDWYLAGPKNRGAVQISFLNGVRLPRLRRNDGTTISGVQWVVEFDVGVDAVEWRTIDRNPGA